MNKLTSLAFCVAITALPSFSASAGAAGQRYATWTVGEMDAGDGLYASSVNDSGLIFGEYCYFSSATCIWLISADSACDKDAKYPALGNTDQGAAPLELICLGEVSSPNEYAYAFGDWAVLEGMLKKSSRLGLAVPLASDQFKVWRFSLIGMNEAVTTMERSFSARAPKPRPSSGTTTTTL